jgi:hypothetical protein
MVPIREFVGTLAVAGKSFKEIQETDKNAYGNKAIKRTQIYCSRSRRRAEKVDKRIKLDYTHGLFIT